NPDSQQFQSAQRACQKYLPIGKAPSPARLAKMQETFLRFARCMRSHGVPSFPDPQISTKGGGVAVKIGGPGSELPALPARADGVQAVPARRRQGHRRPGPPGRQGRRGRAMSRRRLIAAGVVGAAAAQSSNGGVDNGSATSLATVKRQPISSQTLVSATLGYADTATIVASGGTSTSAIQQAQQS